MSIQHLGSMTWKDLKEFCHERVIALLPLGAIEAHGPHLPLNTDVVLATEVARRTARKVAAEGRDVLVYPPIVFTPAAGSVEFAGTVDVDPDTYTLYLLSVLSQVHGAGARTACLVTCHTDPSHRTAVARCAKEIASTPGLEDLRIVAPDLKEEPWVNLMPEEFRTGRSHAGHFETSCMLAIQPDKVREEIRAKLPRVVAGPDGKPQAYVGDPASASSAHGEDYLEALATIFADAVDQGAA